MPTINCDERGTRAYADETVSVLERILKGAEARRVDGTTVHYGRAVAEWSVS